MDDPTTVVDQDDPLPSDEDPGEDIETGAWQGDRPDEPETSPEPVVD